MEIDTHGVVKGSYMDGMLRFTARTGAATSSATIDARLQAFYAKS